MDLDEKLTRLTTLLARHDMRNHIKTLIYKTPCTASCKIPTLKIISFLILLSAPFLSFGQTAEKSPPEMTTDELISYLNANEDAAETRSARIRTKDIDSWQVIDHHHILVKSKRNRKNFVISFKNECHQIDRDVVMTYRADSGYLSKLDSIYLVDRYEAQRMGDVSQGFIGPSMMPANPLEVCQIDKIVELKDIENQEADDSNEE